MYSKTELTEIRKQIFPRYIGSAFKNGNILTFDNMNHAIIGYSILQLKPLSLITNEHKKLLKEINLFGYMDFYRSLGYATSQLVILNGKPITLSVEQQIESLIIETKN